MRYALTKLTSAAARVRMGSFTSRPMIASSHDDEDAIDVPQGVSHSDFLEWVRRPLGHLPTLLPREYRPASPDGGGGNSVVPKFRLMQWNILAQALGTHADNFVRCPPDALLWGTRKYRILEEIIKYKPDVVCLQEVDHFKLLESVLSAQQYAGFFLPKPDSPCIYLPENSGPDGCALFYRRDKFRLVEKWERVLEVWRVQSNQVALLVTLEELQSGKEITFLTTHLKARKGALLSSLRNEQGKDVLSFLEQHRDGRPAIVCGDMNAEPSEPVYRTLMESPPNLSSAYAVVNGGQEPPYSTWKIRGDGEAKHNLDYVMYTKDITVEGAFDHPTEEEIGPERAPSYRYSSDHFALICDFSLREREGEKEREEVKDGEEEKEEQVAIPITQEDNRSR